jgi:hypothetical protein
MSAPVQAMSRYGFERAVAAQGAREEWMPHARRRDRVHQPRNGRRRSSELIQHDGDHQRFEGRAKWCTLLVFVDAANSSLQQTQHAAGLGRHSMSAHVSSGRASRDQVALNSRSRDR